jgi:hypothetical protein
MARAVIGAGVVGGFLFLLAILIVAPYLKRTFGGVDGFADLVTCPEGLRPANQEAVTGPCVPIYPKYNINSVVPGGY